MLGDEPLTCGLRGQNSTTRPSGLSNLVEDFYFYHDLSPKIGDFSFKDC